MAKFLSPETPKVSNRKIYVFWWISKIPYKGVPSYPALSVFEIKKGYLVSLDFIRKWKFINLFISFDGHRPIICF